MAEAKLRCRCRYGAGCYRGNHAHHLEFAHPGDPDWDSAADASKAVVPSSVPTLTPTPARSTAAASVPTTRSTASASALSAAIGMHATRICCKYGAACYRHSQEHRAEYSHPGDADWCDQLFSDAAPSAKSKPCQTDAHGDCSQNTTLSATSSVSAAASDKRLDTIMQSGRNPLPPQLPQSSKNAGAEAQENRATFTRPRNSCGCGPEQAAAAPAPPLPPPSSPDGEAVFDDDIANGCDFSIAHEWLNRLSKAQLDSLKGDLQQMASKFGLAKAVLAHEGPLTQIQLTSSGNENLFQAHEELCNPDGILSFYHSQLSHAEAQSGKKVALEHSMGDAEEAEEDLRVDPETGNAHTFKQLMLHYEGSYTQQEIQEYWEVMTPHKW